MGSRPEKKGNAAGPCVLPRFEHRGVRLGVGVWTGSDGSKRPGVPPGQSCRRAGYAVGPVIPPGQSRRRVGCAGRQIPVRKSIQAQRGGSRDPTFPDGTRIPWSNRAIPYILTAS
jgi:hypothetical protein